MTDDFSIEQFLDKLPEMSLESIEWQIADWCKRRVRLPIGAYHYIDVYADKRRKDVLFFNSLLQGDSL